MLKLIQNESIKIALRLRTWIMAALIVVIVVVAAVIINAHLKPSTNWKQTLLSQNSQAEAMLSQPHGNLPATARAQIKAQVAVNTYDIAHNLPPGHQDAWIFTIGALSVAQIGVVFVTVVAGDIVAGEFASGTIKALLTQPVNRTRIILSKYLSILLVTCVMFALVLVSSIIVGGIFFGMSGVGEPFVLVNAKQVVTQMTAGSYILLGYAFALISGVMIVTIAFMISAVFRSSSLAIAISIITLFVGVSLVHVLSSFSWDKYILFSNTNLMQYITGGPPVAGMTMGFSIAVLAIYFIVLNAISWRVFVQRDVSS
ncbi:MAG: ABC transporter permease [Bacilli bacterium]